MMEILENREEWHSRYREGWLAHFQATGEMDWKERYVHPRNTIPIAGGGIDLANSRLILITSAGSYIRDQQQPFHAEDPYGDYSIRLYPSAASLDMLGFAHDHYDHSFVEEDPQVLVPLRHLENLVAEGLIGALTLAVISYSGYMPDITRIIDETIPKILEAAQQLDSQAALLVPSSPLCCQSVGLIARGLEMNGIATTLTSWSAGGTRLTMPPRATITRLKRGSTLGRPGDYDQQRRVLEATLELLFYDAPLEPITLEEYAE